MGTSCTNYWHHKKSLTRLRKSGKDISFTLAGTNGYCLILQTLPFELVKAKPGIVEFFCGSLFWCVNGWHFPSKGSMLMSHGKRASTLSLKSSPRLHTPKPQCPIQTHKWAAACYDCFFIGTRDIRKMSQKMKSLGIRGFFMPPFIITCFPFWPCSALEDMYELSKYPCQLVNPLNQVHSKHARKNRFYDLRLIELIKDFTNFTPYLWSGLWIRPSWTKWWSRGWLARSSSSLSFQVGPKENTKRA